MHALCAKPKSGSTDDTDHRGSKTDSGSRRSGFFVVRIRDIRAPAFTCPIELSDLAEMSHRTTLAILATLSFCFAAPIRAQSAPSFPTDDPVLKRIWSIGMDSSRVEQLAATLIDSIGPRLTGTAIQRNAQQWLVAQYRSWGIDAVNERYGTWRGWRRGPSHVDMITPRMRTLEATMVGFSPGTRGR